MPSWTSPKTWGSEILTSSDMNTYVRDDLLYLYGIVSGVSFSGTQITRVAAQSIPDSTYTPVSFSAETLDYGGWWSSGTDIIVPAGAIPSGYTTIAVLIHQRVKFASNATGSRFVHALVNGASLGSINISGLSGDTTDLVNFDIAVVAAADVITMQVKQTSGGALNVTNSQMSVLRFAPAT